MKKSELAASNEVGVLLAALLLPVCSGLLFYPEQDPAGFNGLRRLAEAPQSQFLP